MVCSPAQFNIVLCFLPLELVSSTRTDSTLAWVARDLRFPRRLCCDRERSAGGRCALASDMPVNQEMRKKHYRLQRNLSLDPSAWSSRIVEVREKGETKSGATIEKQKEWWYEKQSFGSKPLQQSETVRPVFSTWQHKLRKWACNLYVKAGPRRRWIRRSTNARKDREGREIQRRRRRRVQHRQLRWELNTTPWHR